jgi:hypothetical protein
VLSQGQLRSFPSFFRIIERPFPKLDMSHTFSTRHDGALTIGHPYTIEELRAYIEQLEARITDSPNYNIDQPLSGYDIDAADIHDLYVANNVHTLSEGLSSSIIVEADDEGAETETPRADRAKSKNFGTSNLKKASDRDPGQERKKEDRKSSAQARG